MPFSFMANVGCLMMTKSTRFMARLQIVTKEWVPVGPTTSTESVPRKLFKVGAIKHSGIQFSRSVVTPVNDTRIEFLSPFDRSLTSR